MEMRSAKEWIVRSAILMVGLTIAHLGVTLFLLSDLGADPFNVMVQGIFGKLEAAVGTGIITHGRTHMAVSLLIIAVLLFAGKSSYACCGLRDPCLWNDDSDKVRCRNRP